MSEIKGHKKTVLIAGATDGIGLILLRKFLDEGHVVIGTGSRTRKHLPENWPDKAHYLKADQSDPKVSETIAGWLNKKGYHAIDLLVLNAGTGKVIKPQNEIPENLLATLQVNLHASISIVHVLAPSLKASQNAQVTIVGSVARKGQAAFASYAASKAGLAGFVRALASEWQDSIKVQLIDPGPVATAMHEKAGVKKTRLNRFFLDPEKVATRMVHHIKRGRTFVTVSYWDMFKMKLFGPDQKGSLS